MKNNFNSHYIGYIFITLLLCRHYKPMEILRIFCENSKYNESECRRGINRRTTVV
jgi:hypothetical protein